MIEISCGMRQPNRTMVRGFDCGAFPIVSVIKKPDRERGGLLEAARRAQAGAHRLLHEAVERDGFRAVGGFVVGRERDPGQRRQRLAALRLREKGLRDQPERDLVRREKGE